MADLIHKIRRRIMTRQMIECKTIDEIQITKKEAEKLGDRRVIDHVKLKVVEKLGDMSKKDCFAYIDRNGHKSCYCLKNLYCQNRRCKFYTTDTTIQEIEKSIRSYAYGK